MKDPSQLYSAIAGGENAAHRILNNASEMIRNQGNDEAQVILVEKQLLLLNIATAATLAYRSVLLEKQAMAIVITGES